MGIRQEKIRGVGGPFLDVGVRAGNLRRLLVDLYLRVDSVLLFTKRTARAARGSIKYDFDPSSRRSLCEIFIQICVALVGVSPAFADPFSMGVPEVDGPLNILETQHPAAMIAREASVGGLTRLVGDEKGSSVHQVKLMLADNYDVSADHSIWKFRVRGSARFVNGQPVLADDVRFSLERCMTLGLTPWLKQTSIEKDVKGADELVRLNVDTADTQLLAQIPELVSRCPIVEEASSKLFGNELGIGTNLVGTGPYRIVENLRNRRIRLLKSGEALNGPGPSEIELRTFSDPGHGLTALRTGTLDLLFTEDPVTLDKAKKDETLSLSKCSIYNVVLRRGLSFSCAGSFDFKSLRYAD
jgi:ABC-type transport system substrate-binding protein